MSHRFRKGTIPILVSIPHNGSHIPESVAANMTEAGRSSRDTDWYLDRLYDFPELAAASMLVANESRYVIDLNRPDNDDSLYPGQTTTGLIPTHRFDGQPIYVAPPTDSDIHRRIQDIWLPYHQQIESELQRLVREHSIAVLIEAHSIESTLPRLFDGTLPDFSIGTNHNQSCSPELTKAVLGVLEPETEYSHVCNDRFIGGFITRQYGDPANHRHAIQFELAQSTYMDEHSKAWSAQRASQVQPVFRRIISGIRKWLELQ